MAIELFKLVGSIMVNSDEANKSISKTEKNAEGVGNKLKSGIKTAAKWGAGVAVAAGTAAVAIGGKAVKAASDFEKKFAKVQTLLSDTTDMDSYKQSIIDASNEMGVAVDEYSEAVYNAISAGVKQDEAVEFTKTAMKLAAGGFTDASTAVDVTTTALNAFGTESGLTADKVSDLLITTQNLGKTTVNELASSVGKVIPVASAYGVNMENLSATYATLTAGGIATAESTTYMKSMLNELGDSGSNVSKILQEQTGSSFGELMKSGSSLGDVIAILGDSVGNDSGKFNELWSSSEAGVGALTLLNTGADAFNTTLGKMQDSTGATQSAYEKMHGTLNATIDTIKVNLQNALIQLGTDSLPIIKQFANFLISSLPIISTLIKALSPVISKIFSALLPPVKELIGSLLPLIPPLIEAIMPVINMVVKVVRKLIPLISTGLAVAIKALTPIISGLAKVAKRVFGSLIGFIKPPINAIIKAVNTVINSMNKLKIPDWVPGFGGKGLNLPTFKLLRVGIDYVPNDNYPALLHEGEAVLTKQQAYEWRNGKSGNNDDIVYVINLLIELLPSLIAQGMAGTEWSIGKREFARLVKKNA